MGKQGKIKPKRVVTRHMESRGVDQALYENLTTYSKPKAVFDSLRKYVKGQDDTLKKLALVSAQRDAAILSRCDSGLEIDAEETLFNSPSMHSSLLVSGNSGCGKTHMVYSLSKLVAAPMIHFDISQYTGAGWKGKDVETLLDDIRQFLVENGRNGLRTIVFIDEIDKILVSNSPTADHKHEVQNELLLALDRYGAATLPNTLLWVFAGSFTTYRSLKAKENNRGGIGFGSKTKVEEAQLNYKMSRIDYTSAGLSNEFMGRITHVSTLNPVGKKELREILDSEEGSPLVDLFDLAHYMDINLDINDVKRDKIVEEALKMGTGVRGLRTAAELVLFDEVF